MDRSFKHIKNIIFDLGGVIIDIDFELTNQAFSGLLNRDVNHVRRRIDELDIYDRYEKGVLSDAQFRDLIREEFEVDRKDDEIDEAWCALLGDLPMERINLIKELSKRYRVFLLSNTSPIHIVGVHQILLKVTGETSLDNLFEKAYYSYDLNLRKPGNEIYEHVLSEQSLDVKETLFLDDNFDNIVGAQNLGVDCIHVKKPYTILDYLKKA